MSQTRISSLPPGVKALSSIEMWERFSFYILQTLLVLYANAASAAGGLGWSAEAAIRISGTYGALVYISPIVGGVIADRFMGRRFAAALGAILMGLGQLVVMIHSTQAFYAGLGLLVLGCGFLKPSISAMVGEFFSESDHKRHSAFSVFYMAINIGGLLGTFLSGFVSDQWGFRYAFLLGAIGFAIALFNLLSASRGSLSQIGLLQSKQQLQALGRLTALEKKRMRVYLGMCVANIVWNIVYALPFGLLTYDAEKHVDNRIAGFQFPVTWYLAFYSVLIIVFSYGMAKGYDYLHSRGITLTLNQKLTGGYLTLALGCMILLPLVYSIQYHPDYMAKPWLLLCFYTIFAISELLTIPVMLSAATQMAPKQYAATLVSANMFICWGLGSYLGGEFGALTLHYSAVRMFSVLIIVSIALAIFHKCYDRRCERLCAS